jgi:hypothetical protein
MFTMRRLSAGIWCAIAASAVTLAAQDPRSDGASSAPARILIVGGGPDRLHNQVAIESNVRYVSRLLPEPAASRVLFADGDLQAPTVQYQTDSRTLAYRVPDLPRLDGRAEHAVVRAAIAAVAHNAHASSTSELMLYFTGHGSGDARSNYANNWFDLWSGGRFTVRDLSESIAEFPPDVPVTLIMVQCFSGAFGNVLFQGGDPQGAVIPQRVAGFFAAQPNRLAAGCTPALNEAEYRDFTSYFFAALTGEDRMRRPVSGADYDHDSRVGMNEAFAWALVHDDSIDTPVATSDTFVRRFSTLTDEAVASTTFEMLESWATPAQRAALDGLSDALNLGGEGRLRTAFEKIATVRPASQQMADVRLMRFVNLSRSVAETHDIFTSGDETVRQQLTRLLQDEARNPIR